MNISWFDCVYWIVPQVLNQQKTFGQDKNCNDILRMVDSHCAHSLLQELTDNRAHFRGADTLRGSVARPGKIRLESWDAIQQVNQKFILHSAIQCESQCLQKSMILLIEWLNWPPVYEKSYIDVIRSYFDLLTRDGPNSRAENVLSPSYPYASNNLSENFKRLSEQNTFFVVEDARGRFQLNSS